jgi:hypothetical protein
MIEEKIEGTKGEGGRFFQFFGKKRKKEQGVFFTFHPPFYKLSPPPCSWCLKKENDRHHLWTPSL